MLKRGAWQRYDWDAIIPTMGHWILPLHAFKCTWHSVTNEAPMKL